jgi:hypothetical protein
VDAEPAKFTEDKAQSEHRGDGHGEDQDKTLKATRHGHHRRGRKRETARSCYRRNDNAGGLWREIGVGLGAGMYGLKRLRKNSIMS